MTTVVSFGEHRFAHLPGPDPTSIPVEVRNASNVVRQYSLTVLGDLASFAMVTPPQVNLYPGTSATVVVSLTIPRSPQVRAGQHPLGVRVTPSLDDQYEGPVTKEVLVEVLPFVQTTAELLPRSSQGRFGAVHNVAIDNWGNAKINAALVGSDPTGALNFQCGNPTIEVEPGEARNVVLHVRPHTSLWLGRATSHPFSLAIKVEDNPDPGSVLDGVYVQTPVIAKWFVRSLIGIAALMVLLAVLWPTMLRPTAPSEAIASPSGSPKPDPKTDSSPNPDPKTDSSPNPDPKTDSSPNPDPDSSPNPDPDSSPNPDPDSSPNPDPDSSPSPPSPIPFSDSLDVAAAADDSKTEEFSLDGGKKYEINQVIFTDPQVDTGTVVLIVSNPTTGIETTVADTKLEDIPADEGKSLDISVDVTPGSEVSLRIDCRQPGTDTSSTLASPSDPSASPSNPQFTSCRVGARISGKSYSIS